MTRSRETPCRLGALLLALSTGACGEDALDATTRARIYGCLDRAPQQVRTLPARGYALSGLGCDDLRPDDVRAVLPAWRAERDARRLAAQSRG